MHTCLSERLAFPSAHVNHPPCRYLLVFVVHRVMRHAGINGGKLLVFLTTYNRIHEEAAGVAFHFRVGKFGIAYVCYRIAQLPCRRILNAPAVKLAPYVTIINMWNKLIRQTVCNVSYDETIAPVGLETTVTIRITAIGV